VTREYTHTGACKNLSQSDAENIIRLQRDELGELRARIYDLLHQLKAQADIINQLKALHAKS